MATRALVATGVLGILASSLVALMQPGTAVAAINQQINFQGKLVNTDGTNIPNGTYNIEFKLYTGGDGCVPGGSTSSPCGGTLQWTEDHVYGGGSPDNRVTVTDGVFQVDLGSITSLPAIFNNSTIWLSINLGDTTTAATFGAAGGDGEMLPFIRFTASPYALNSDLLDGLDSSAFGQLQTPGSEVAQTGSLAVSGNMIAQTSLQAPLVDTATATTLNIGTGTASQVTIGRTSTPFLIQGNASSSFTITDSGNTTTVGFAAPTANHTITFPNAGGTVCTTDTSTCGSVYGSAGTFLAKDGADTSTFAVTAANYLYGFRNSNTGVASGVLKLDNDVNTGNALYVTASGNPGAGSALIVANNTNGTPSGNLIDLQKAGASEFAVDYNGNVSQNGGSSTTDTVNGQRISSAANFTGTVTAATSVLSPLFDAATGGGTLSVGTSAAGAINLGSPTSNNNTTITGNTLVQPSSAGNSATTFQVDNNNSQNLLKIDTLNNNIVLGGNNSPVLQPWATSGVSLPGSTTRIGAASVTANGYAYEIAGGTNSATSSATNTVFYTKLNSDGSINSWSTANALPTSLFAPTAVVANGFVYVMGGANGGGDQSTVYYARMNSDGTVGSWITGTALLAARQGATSAVANGYVYVMGGSGATTVYYSKLSPDGSVGAWNTTNTLPTGRVNSTTVVANGFVYVIGGSTSATTVYYASFNSNGTLSTWTTNANPLPAGFASAVGAVANGYVYFISGSNNTANSGATANYVYATLNANGSIGTWTTVSSSLPAVRWGASGVIANGYIYVFAGNSGSGNTSGAYYTSTQRVQVGGSLDLIGLAGQNLSNGGSISTGSTAGSIVAGNITSVGVLQVQGQGVFSQSLTANGNLSVAGYTAFQNTSNSANAFEVQNSSGNNILNVDTSGSIVTLGNVTSVSGQGTAGVLRLADGTADNFAITLNTGASALTASHTISFPDAGGTVCLQSAAACGFATGTGAAYVQGGNNFGGTGNLGLTSANDLNILTNNTARITIKSAGEVDLASGSDLKVLGGVISGKVASDSLTTPNLQIQTSTGNNLLTVAADSSHSRLGFNLGSTNLPTLSGSGVEINGALQLDGGSTPEFNDSFTTPAGTGGIMTKILIPVYNPGNFGQIIAFGINSSSGSPASNTSRAISLFDQRGYQSGSTSVQTNYTATPHQPTINVFSPDENQTLGFSWEGLNTTGYVKTSADQLTLRVSSSTTAGLDAVQIINSGGNASVGIGRTPTTYALEVQGSTMATTSVLAPLVDTPSGTTTLNIGTNNATSGINLNQNTTIATGKNLNVTSGTLTVGSAGAGNGALVNNGSTKNTSLALGDLAAGSIGSAATTVNIYTSFTISPAASGRTYTIPAPTAGAGSIIYISNINASSTFVIGSTTFSPHSTATLVYDGTGWNFAGMDGGSNNYIQNQNTSTQTANFQINGTGQANTSILTALLDTQSGTTTLNVGTNNATSGINLNQNTTIAAGKNFSTASGAGTITQNYSATTGTGTTLNATDSSASGASTEHAQDVALTGHSTSGTNALTGLNFNGVTAIANNTFTAINVGLGFNDLLDYNGTQLISGAGLVQNNAIGSAINYSNLTSASALVTVGALASGSIASGFGTISTGNNITTTATLQGGTINATTAFQANGTPGVGATCASGDSLTGAHFAEGILTAGTCTTVGGGGTFLAKNATDTSTITGLAASAFGYTFTNGTTGPTTASGVLKLDNGSNTGSTLKVTSAANAAAGSALVLVTDTNATPSGNLIDLQSGTSPVSVFNVSALGVATLAGNQTADITVQAAASTSNGNSLTLVAGTGGSSGNHAGGDAILQGGTGSGSGLSGIGGTARVKGGAAPAGGAGGLVVISAAAGGSSAANGVGPGGDIQLQAGSAAGNNNSGGSIYLTAGTAHGTTGSGIAPGVVSIGSPVFTSQSETFTQTSNNQGFTSITDPTLQTNLDAYGTIVMNVTGAFTGATVTMPSPTNQVAGRVVYVSAASGSVAFTLAATGMSSVNMSAGNTATLVWNGSGWSGTTTASSLQQVYNNTSTAPASIITTSTTKNILFQAGVGDDNANLFQVGNANAAPLLHVDSTNTATGANVAHNSGVETLGSGSVCPTSGAPTGWSAYTGTVTPTLCQNTSATNLAAGLGSLNIHFGSAGTGGANNDLNATALSANQIYNVSFNVKAATSAPTNANLIVEYYRDATNLDATCTTASGGSISTSGFFKWTCWFQTGASGQTTANFIRIRQADSAARDLYIDNLFVGAQSTSGALNSGELQVGGPLSQGLTLFQLDSFANDPVAGSVNQNMLGSMYYSTTLGRIQCYESDGWGSCGAAPDSNLILEPEYGGAVLNPGPAADAHIGTMTANVCSAAQAINATICSTSGNEFNYYQWTTSQVTAQTYSIYVKYQLPPTFGSFLSTPTLSGRVTSTTDATLAFEIFTNAGATCGSSTATNVITGGANTWFTTAYGTDPNSCGFSPGDLILFRVDMSAKNNADSYAGRIQFSMKGK